MDNRGSFTPRPPRDPDRVNTSNIIYQIDSSTTQPSVSKFYRRLLDHRKVSTAQQPQHLTLKDIAILTLNPDRMGAPRFSGKNITEFLDDYDYECDMALIPLECRAQILPLFCATIPRQVVRNMLQVSKAKGTEWEAFQDELRDMFELDDELRSQRSTIFFLEEWVKNMHEKQPIPVRRYYHDFMRAAMPVRKNKQVGEGKLGWLFFKGLSLADQQRVRQDMLPEEDRPVGFRFETFKLKEMYDFLK